VNTQHVLPAAIGQAMLFLQGLIHKG